MIVAGRAYLGLISLAAGLVWLLDEAEVLDGPEVMAEWWPAAVVGLGVMQLLGDPASVIGSSIVVGSGLILLGFTTGLLSDASFGVFWAVLLIGGGAWFLAGRPGFTRGDAGARLAAVTTLRSTRLASRSDVFEGGNVTVVLGGSTIDLERSTPVAQGAELNATVILGGLDVIVPSTWKVHIRGLPIFGFWDDTRRRTAEEEDGPSLVIRALVVFGGIDVKARKRWG